MRTGMKIKARARPRQETRRAGEFSHRELAQAIAGGLLLCLAFAGCGTPLVTIEIEPLQFDSEQPPIAGAIGVCLPKKVRGATWRNQQRAMVQLGGRFALNLERMARSSFQTVDVSLATPCFFDAPLPRLKARIVEAERHVPGWSFRASQTELAIGARLSDASGAEIWSTTVKESVSNSDFVSFREGTMAARDFGTAMERAFDRIFEEVMSSPAIRLAIQGPEPEPMPDEGGLENSSAEEPEGTETESEGAEVEPEVPTSEAAEAALEP